MRDKSLTLTLLPEVDHSIFDKTVPNIETQTNDMLLPTNLSTYLFLIML